MGHTQRIALRDIENVNQLINECRELWADPAAWRQRLAEGTRELIHSVVTGVDQRTLPDLRIVVLATTGWPDEGTRKRFLQGVLQAGDPGMPLDHHHQIMQMRKTGQITHDVPKSVGEQAWRGCGFYQASFEPTGLDHLITSLHLLPHEKQLIAVNGQRMAEEKPFSTREVTMLSLIVKYIAPLIGTVLATESQISTRGLTPRVQETLKRLLEGKTEKRIAKEMFISPQTVHQYVRTLYRHFKVHSRAELMAYFLEGRPREKTRL